MSSAPRRAYAQHWVDVQREQLKRLGISAQWDKPYFDDELPRGRDYSELFKFAESGQLYGGAKPVMWSPVEKTALAEAEIEYEDIRRRRSTWRSRSSKARSRSWSAHAVIWTTTPWTIPVNQGSHTTWMSNTSCFLQSISTCSSRSRLSGLSRSEAVCPSAADQACKGSELAGTVARHPMTSSAASSPSPALPAGRLRDYRSGHRPRPAQARPAARTISSCAAPMASIRCSPSMRAASTAMIWAWLGGQGSVINAKFNARRPDLLRPTRGRRAARGERGLPAQLSSLWRSKAKVIYRCTPQWFIAMDRPLPSWHCESFAEQRWTTRARGRANADASPAGDQGHRRHAFRAREGPQPARIDG